MIHFVQVIVLCLILSWCVQKLSEIPSELVKILGKDDCKKERISLKVWRLSEIHLSL
jgi:hypothetical protein